MTLYQPITIENEIVPCGENGFFFLVRHARHQAERHTPRSELLCVAALLGIRGVVAGVGVDEPAALRVEDAVETGDERAGRDICVEDLVGLSQHPPWDDITPSGDGAKHALG